MYRAYLLRCWQEKSGLNGERPLWRFSLERILPIDGAAGVGRGEAAGGLGAGPGERSGPGSGGTLGASGEGRRMGFGSLDKLLAFLETELDREDGIMDDEE